MTYTKPHAERVLLVGLGEQYAFEKRGARDPLEELRLLAETAGAEVVGTLVQTRNDITPRFYIGTGKADELKALVESTEASTVIFDNELTPAQVRNLHDLLNDIKVIDRPGLILDIFALRARTSESRIQVELAQLRHMLPRLTRQWTHLSRQVGGIGVRGPGETQLEVDRRRVRDRIGHLAEKLKQIEKRGETVRKGRENTFTVSLAGYTNAGKSTLFNALSRSDAPVEDRLFKTLDTMTRRMIGEHLPEIIVSDTVGFIRDLPHELVASFRSTLDDVRGADLLLHVIDITSPDWEQQMEVVEKVLGEISAGEIEVIPVFNKIDRLEHDGLTQALAARFPNARFVSAKTGLGVPELIETVTAAALRSLVRVTVDLDPADGELLSELYRCGTVLESVSHDEKLRLTCSLPSNAAKRLGLTPKES